MPGMLLVPNGMAAGATQPEGYAAAQEMAIRHSGPQPKGVLVTPITGCILLQPGPARIESSPLRLRRPIHQSSLS